MYNINDITNKVIFGNSEEELLKISDESIDAVIIDPPYRYLKHKLDRPFNERLIFENLYRVLKKNSLMVIFGIGSQLCRDIVMLEDVGFKCKEEVIWVKDKISNFFSNLPRRHESFYILSKGNKVINKCYVDYFDNSLNENAIYRLKQTYDRIVSALKNKEELNSIKKYLETGQAVYREVVSKNGVVSSKKYGRPDVAITYVSHLMNGNTINSVIHIPTENYDYEHATQKPIELMSRIVKLVSNENDILLDCFAGSGSTLLGAIKNDRNYIGIEIDKEYYDVCIKRLKEQQGLFYKEATNG